MMAKTAFSEWAFPATAMELIFN